MLMVKQVIIADDDDSLRRMYSDMIEAAVPDATIVCVDNGRDLVAKVREGGYQLVFTDYDMRDDGMTGLRAIIKIRQFDFQTPIFMASGSEVEIEALEAGATGYIDKGDRNMWKRVRELALEYLV